MENQLKRTYTQFASTQRIYANQEADRDAFESEKQLQKMQKTEDSDRVQEISDANLSG